MISSELSLEAEDSQVVSEDKRVEVRFSQVWEEWVDLEAVEIILNSLIDLVDRVFIILNFNNFFNLSKLIFFHQFTLTFFFILSISFNAGRVGMDYSKFAKF